MLPTQQPPKTVLALAIGGLGDVVLFLPSLKLLRERWADAHITLALAAGSQAAGLFERWPWVNEVRVLPWSFHWPPPAGFFEELHHLRRRRFDLSVFAHAQGTWKKELVGFAIGARRRLQHCGARPWARAAACLNESIALAEAHATEMNIDLLARVGVYPSGPQDLAPSIPIATEDRDHAMRRLPRAGSEPLIGLHPAGNLSMSRARTWPLRSYAALIDQLRRRLGARFVLFGREAERPILADLRERSSCPGSIEIIVDESLKHIPALTERLDFFCGNMSSLVLIAGAVGTPVVAVCGPTSEVLTAPRGPFAWVACLGLPCRPCFLVPASRYAHRCRNQIPYQCLTELPPEPIADLIAAFLQTPADMRAPNHDGATRHLRLSSASPSRLNRRWRTIPPLVPALPTPAPAPEPGRRAG